MLLDEAQRHGYVAPAHTVVLREGNFRLEPELRLATWPLNMHVKTRLLSREKEEPQASCTEDCRAHGESLARAPRYPRMLTAQRMHQRRPASAAHEITAVNRPAVRCMQ
jgi:hypothetical protein